MLLKYTLNQALGAYCSDLHYAYRRNSWFSGEVENEWIINSKKYATHLQLGKIASTSCRHKVRKIHAVPSVKMFSWMGWLSSFLFTANSRWCYSWYSCFFTFFKWSLQKCCYFDYIFKYSKNWHFNRSLSIVKIRKIFEYLNSESHIMINIKPKSYFLIKHMI